MSMMDRELAPGEAGELFDLRQAQQLIGMLFRSVKRHKTRALVAFVTIAMASVLLGYSTPKQYLSYSTMQLKPSNISDYLAPNEIRAQIDPRKGVKETVLQQKNLESVVDQLKLVDELAANKSPIGRVFGLLSRGGAADPDAKRRDAVDELRKNLTIRTPTEEGVYETVIAVTWTNPITATNIAKLLQDNFIEARRQEEVTFIEPIVALLQTTADRQQESFEEITTRIGPVNPIDMSASDQASLTSAQSKLTEAQAKLDNSKLAFEGSKADFDIRYSVSQEPQIPKRALNGRLRSYILGLAAGTLAAFLVAGLADLMKGAFIESWQVVRKLNLPVLAEIPN
jgi:uncharacterized protein involved in exopolysaccharide biosynthesis